MPEINSEERGGVVVLQLEGETIEICALKIPSKCGRELGALIQTAPTRDRHT